MRRMIPTVLFMVAVLFLVVGSIYAQDTRPFKMTISGVGGIPLRSEIEGNPISLSLCGGKTNLPGGSFTCYTTGYNTLEFQGFDTTNCPGGMELQYGDRVVNHVVQFATGDVQYWVPDANAYDYVCSYGDHGTSVSHWLLVGGSGPYEGASGTSVFYGKFDGLPLGPYLMLGFHPGLIEGTITFPE